MATSKRRMGRGPALALSARFEEGRLLSTSLAPSDQFTVEVMGDAGDRGELLLHWAKAYSERRHLPVDRLCDLADTPPFRARVLNRLMAVEMGETLSYGELAASLGAPLAQRAVGTACGRNPFPLLIPCHRILAKGGSLGGFLFGLEIKKMLLKFEAALLI